MAEGLSNKKLATRLQLSETTVKKHATNVMRKMGVSNRVEAALHFLQYDMSTQFLAP